MWGADRQGALDGMQLSFAHQPTWGGPRKNGGRKSTATRPQVRHRERPVHRAWCPVHVTMRRAKGLPSLRSELVQRELCAAIRATRRDDFRIVEFSVQADHVHLIVEAESGAALSAGMKSFSVRAARRLNTRVLRRRGSLWGDRYHRRDLGSPRAVRAALVYVINNHLKHGEHEAGLVDECSSAPWFSGWMQRVVPPTEPSPTEPARTWLLERGWHDNIHFLHLGELPRAVRS